MTAHPDHRGANEKTIDAWLASSTLGITTVASVVIPLTLHETGNGNLFFDIASVFIGSAAIFGTVDQARTAYTASHHPERLQ